MSITVLQVVLSGSSLDPVCLSNENTACMNSQNKTTVANLSYLQFLF